MNPITRCILILRRPLHWVREINAAIASYWLNKRSTPLPTLAVPTVVFAPHPDDESLGCGGTIAIRHALGQEIRVVFVTDGAFSTDPESRVVIALQRQQEAIEALGILGIDKHCITFLNYPDGTLQKMSPPKRAELIQELQKILAPYPQVEVFVPHHHDRHPDHEATCCLVKAALETFPGTVQLWQYPIWVLWKTPCIQLLTQLLTHKSGWHSLAIGRVMDHKKRAIAAHRSQVEGALPPGFLKRFQQPYELFWKD